jgi:hypothetical protein
MLQRDQIGGLQRSSDPIRADVIDNECVVNTGARHRHHIFQGHRSRREWTRKSRFNLGTITSFDVVQALTDDCSGECSYSGSDERACGGIPNRFAHQGTDSGPA